MPHLALHISCEIAVGDVFEMAFHSIFVVHNIHVSMLVYPQFTNNNVMDSGRNLAPRIVIACVTSNSCQLQVPYLFGSITLTLHFSICNLQPQNL